jgi:deoxycytidylate deaminase
MISVIDKYISLAKAMMPIDLPARCYHVSFATYKGKIISIGFNSAKTNPINLKNRKKNSCGKDYSEQKMTCSELSCLKKVKNKTNIPFNKITLINVRIDRNGDVRCSKPCESCEKLIDFLGIKRILYT